ncbi:type 1 glutamine amidotransferase [Luteolibacter arcticus]|uniref:Type 1 glutamine amidotransferase n=1 Tax=Luteolibacter arcticus TaxID=1581411 RepID=A0ABT3GQW4_9BACT|nr:type 1 glutamine amidotransferase domain-containing protein [Luteolibacter arcticus]MCW1925880.1 type 1 glutamine amidotransferase [Luteolibacter arcticus]
MKLPTPILASATLSIISAFHAHAQTHSAHELEVINQLTTKPAVASLPVAQFLSAPGNEALKAFFLTPVKKEEATLLKGKRIAVLASDGFEEIELTGPAWYFRALGAQVDIVAPKFTPAPARYGLSTPEMAKDHIMAIQYLNPVGWLKVDRTADQIRVDEYDAIFIPGGAWNPDNLRYDKDVIRFIREFNKTGKLIAAICHAPVVLASADILKGKKLTGYWNIQVDLKNAGGEVLEQPVVTDGNLITSRHPIDVADFSIAVKDWLIAR